MADILPDRWTGIMNRHQQLGLRCDVVQIANQGGTIFAGVQMGMLDRIRTGIEEVGQLFLELTAFLGGVRHIFCHASALPSAFSRNRLRSRIRALCN